MPSSVLRTPSLVSAARKAAGVAGFTHSCTDEFGRLLRVLAAASPGPICELGTGCGVGTAWLVSGRRPGSRVVTVEADPARSAVAADLLRDEPDIEFLVGDWRSALSHGPFGLIFPDCKGTKELNSEIAESIAVGGVAVLDDLTPPWLPQPAERAGIERDEVRESWLDHPGFTGVEIYTTQNTAALIVTRTS